MYISWMVVDALFSLQIANLKRDSSFIYSLEEEGRQMLQAHGKKMLLHYMVFFGRVMSNDSHPITQIGLISFTTWIEAYCHLLWNVMIPALRRLCVHV
jgi:hypothetical protein